MRRVLFISLVCCLLGLCLVNSTSSQKVVRRPIATATPTPTPSTLLTGLVGSWKLDDTSDSTGRGNTLTNNNSVSFTGGFATFVAPSSKYLSKASSADVQTGDVDFTFQFWVTLDNFSSAYQIVSKDDDSGREYYFVKDFNTNGWTFSVFRGGSDVVVNKDHGSFSAGTPYCVIGWHDATANTINLSINNGTAASAATGGALDAAGPGQFRIGAREYPGFEGYLNGTVYNVNKWTRVLTSTERGCLCGGSNVEHPWTGICQ